MDARVYGTRLVWNSVMSTFRAPSKRMEAVRDEMGHEAVQVGVRGAVNVKGAPADVVDRLVVEHDRDVRVLQQGVSAWLHHVGRDLRGGRGRARGRRGSAAGRGGARAWGGGSARAGRRRLGARAEGGGARVARRAQDVPGDG